MILRTIICFLVILSICISCAKQSTPTGGPKDSIPPILVRSFPPNKQLNFKSTKIDLTFDEMISVNNPKEQIIITPTIGKDYEVTAKKKIVTMQFESNFEDSTTYTINFRDAIKDITEKNPARNLQLAFSTGSYIDSMLIEGKVYDLLTEKESSNATVALYQNADTFNIFKHKPIYFTKTNLKGLFKIENLKVGNYFIYAFDDRNKNLIVDSKSESYAFKDSVLTLTANIKNLYLPLIRLDTRPLNLISARPYNKYFNIKTSKNIVSYTLTSDSIKFISSFGVDQANVKIYNALNTTDSIKTNFSAYDSVGNSIDTVLFVKYNPKKADAEKFSFALTENVIEANNGLLRIKMNFNKPITTINFDSLLFNIDSTTTIRFKPDELIWDLQRNSLTIEKYLDKKIFLQKDLNQLKTKNNKTQKSKSLEVNQLQIAKGTFISIDQDSTKEIINKTKILREEETGILFIDIKTKNKFFIVELLDNNYKLIQSIKNTAKIKFENLPPSNYIIKLIIDKNNNGKWDPGNFLNRKEPEPITFYKNEKKSKTINLKANWELGPLLITY